MITSAKRLSDQKIVSFIMTSDYDKAKEFYGNKCGLKLLSEDSFALVFDANGTKLRVSKAKQVKAQPFTVLAWEVEDLAAAIPTMTAAGIEFERFEGFSQDELGIWHAPGGKDKVAWFKDPDGNMLGLSEHS